MSIRLEPFVDPPNTYNMFDDHPDGSSTYIGEVYQGRWDPLDASGGGFSPGELRRVADAVDALEWRL